MKNEGIEKITSDMKQCAESFTKSQKQLREAMNSPNTSKLQAAIDSKREIDKQERIKELEIQNKDLEERIKRTKRISLASDTIRYCWGGDVFFYCKNFCNKIIITVTVTLVEIATHTIRQSIDLIKSFKELKNFITNEFNGLYRQPCRCRTI